jgi:hypothetical protein
LNKVYAIRNYAFSCCGSLDHVVIPEGIDIGDRVFEGCKKELIIERT